MVARDAAVIVEIDPALDGQRDEFQHPPRVVLLRVGIVTDLSLNPEIDAETGSQSLDTAVDSMPPENLSQAAIKKVGQVVDVRIEFWPSISPQSGERGSHCDRVSIVGSAVLAVALRHQMLHDVGASTEHAQRIASPNSLP